MSSILILQNPGSRILCRYGWMSCVCCMMIFWCLPGNAQVMSSLQRKAPPSQAKDSDKQSKIMAVLDLAKVAAEADQPEISFEAVRRISQTGGVIAAVDLGGLLSNNQPNSTPTSTRRGQLTPQQQSSQALAEKLVAINDIWVKKSFDPKEAYRVWKSQVLPADSPTIINVFSSTSPVSSDTVYNSFVLIRQEITPPKKSGMQCLIDWAVATNQLPDLQDELKKRLIQPGNSDVSLLIRLWIADATKADQSTYESILEEFGTTLPAHFTGQHGNLKVYGVIKACNALPTDSECRTRMQKSFLQSLPTNPNWSNNPYLVQWLRQTIWDAIANKQTELADELATAVVSQWANVRSGNESWVANVESNAFMSMAMAAFDKEAYELGGKWLQRVSLNSARQSQSERGWMQLRGSTAQNLAKCPVDIRRKLLMDSVWSYPMLGLKDSAGLMPEPMTPPLFASGNAKALDSICSLGSKSISALEWLMRDAIATGKQADIEQKIAELEENKSEDVTLARLVWQKAQGKPMDISVLIKSTGGEGSNESRKTIQRVISVDSPPLPLEIEIADIAIRNEATRGLGVEFTKQLLEQSIKASNTTLITHCRKLLHEADTLGGKLEIQQDWLKHFVEAMDWDGGALLDGLPAKPVWKPRNESKTAWGHEFSAMQSYLFLKYPLQGPYEIEFKGFNGSYAEPGVSLGGVITEFLPYNQTILLTSTGYRHNSTLAKKCEKYSGDWNSYRIKHTDDRFEIFVNGDSVMAMPARESITSPFVGLVSRSYRSSQIDGFKITGKPTIPRSVTLSTPKLSGWSTYYVLQYLEPLSVLIKEKQGEPDENGYFDEAGEYYSGQNIAFPYWTGQNNGDVAFAWSVKGDVLESVDQRVERAALLANPPNDPQGYVKAYVKGDPSSPRRQAMIYYQRPLCDGESIELEFFQDSNPKPAPEAETKIQPLPISIAPAIGRIAMLLDQPEVALHWIPGDGEEKWFGTKADNRVIDPQAKQLAKAQIKEGEWNRMAIRWNTGTATLVINGQEIYQRRWETNMPSQFGLYHDPQVSQVRVRNVRLVGNWPELLPENLFELRD